MSDTGSQAGEANGHAQEQNKRDEHVARAQEAGWTSTAAFDEVIDAQHAGSNGNWYGNAARYEWSGEYGDVGPEVEELERILFASDLITREGDHMENMIIPVKLEGPTRISPINTASHFTFSSAITHPLTGIS
jgi:ATP-dependent RNA helicase DDX3X